MVYRLSKKLALLLAVLALVGLCGCRSKGLSPGASSSQSGASSQPAQDVPSPDNSAANSLDAAMQHTVPGMLGESDTAGGSSGSAAPDGAAGDGTSGEGTSPDSAVGEDTSQNSASAGPSSGSASLASSDAASSDATSSDPTSSAAAAAMATPSGGAVTVDPAADWPLTLVNDSHLLDEDYQPPLQTVSGSEKQLETHAAAALQELLDAAARDGCPCHLVSGYRSVRYQQGLFNRKVQSYLDQGLPQAEAEDAAAQWVARPGASEHSLGLAVDLVSGDWYLEHDDLTEDFADTPQFAWLQQHAAEYGFILRYPKDKEDVTGVHYEPWHYRYVGEAAADIAASGLTLEEYLQRA